MKRKDIKIRRKRIGAAVCMAVFMFQTVCTMQVYAYNAEEKMGLVFGVDENGEIVTMAPAVTLRGGEGDAYVFSNDDVIDAGVAEYWLTGPTDAYPLEDSDMDLISEDFEIYEWKALGADEDTATLSGASAYEGQSAEFVYLNTDGEVAEANVVISDLYNTCMLTVDGIPGNGVVYPGAILDEDGYCLGIALEPGYVWTPFADEEQFYSESSGGNGGSSGNGNGGSSSGNGGSGGNGNGGSSGNSNGGSSSGGNGDSGSSGDSFGQYGNLIITVVVIAAAAVVILLWQKKKKQPSSPAGAQSYEQAPPPGEPSSHPAQQVWPTPANPYVEPAPDPAAPQGGSGFYLIAVGGHMDGREWNIGENEITFGRDSSSTVRFPADAKGISRVHCRLFWKNGILMLMDSGSSYGTFTKDGKLTPMKPIPIKYGDCFFVGEKNNCFKIQ